MPVSGSEPQRSEPIYYAKASVSPERRLINVPDDFTCRPACR